MSVKIQIARSQLGAALDLFIRNKAPISVHALACGGSEIIEGLATEANLPTLSTHILQTFPDVDMRKIRALRNQYWNAARNDEALMADFSDRANDAPLFMGWLDYMQLTGRLPVEVQVFQVWWYATNEGKMNPNSDPTPYRSLFPGIGTVERFEQKRRLRRVVEKYRNNREILADQRTEQGPLVKGA